MRVTDQIAAAMALAHAGRREEAAGRFLEVWSRLSDRDRLHRLTVAHALADLQDDPRDELTWDLRALSIADQLSDEELAQAGVDATTQSLYPSLHLNVGEAHRKVGDLGAARVHCAEGRAALALLGSDPYDGMLVDAFARLETRIEADARLSPGAGRDPKGGVDAIEEVGQGDP